MKSEEKALVGMFRDYFHVAGPWPSFIMYSTITKNAININRYSMNVLHCFEVHNSVNP